VKGNPNPIKPPSNPEEFDYRRFLQFRNIYHQHFVRKDGIRTIDFAPRSMVVYYALACRSWAMEIITDNISGKREQALASALILGVKDGLDDDLLSAYKTTGSMHVLAVSGLHVGILYGILLLILKPIRKVRYGACVVAGISIGMLWAYAFITGLSPSVLRAVSMFSFAAIANGAGYRTNMYNTLAASAFFILWIDPFMLMSVGFQLSYLAVLGIVYMQSGLYNLWAPEKRVLDQIWKVTCVSLAAQLATF
jgi:competence protein ComEC